MAFWLLLMVILALVVLVVILAVRQRLAREGFVFDTLNQVCAPAEQVFLRTLEQVLDRRYRVFAKVSLAALVRPAPGMAAGTQAAALRVLEGTILDFVISSADTAALVGIVQCVSPGNVTVPATADQEGVEQAMASLNVPILFFSAGRSYAAEELRRRLDECYAPLSVTVTARDQGENQAQVTWFLAEGTLFSETEADSSPLCPRCAAPMVRRHAERGPHAGKAFWACAAYPRCRQLLQL